MFPCSFLDFLAREEERKKKEKREERRGEGEATKHRAGCPPDSRFIYNGSQGAMATSLSARYQLGIC